MLISIIFIAELIIAYQLVSLIVKLDKKVCDINDCVLEFKTLAETFMRYARLLIANLTNRIKDVICVINKRKEETFIKILLFIAINGILITFKIKKVKPNKILKLALAIIDIANDMSIIHKI